MLLYRLTATRTTRFPKTPYSSIPCLASSRYFCSSSSTTTTAQQPQEQEQVDFKRLFWIPINEQKQRTGQDSVKEAAQKFQMIGHVQKLMVLRNATTTSSSDSIFSWSGFDTNHPQVVEDFLIFLSTGFDIKSVDCENNFFLLEHSRNFLGWKPAAGVLAPSSTSSSTSSTTTENADVTKNPNLLQIPFTMNFKLQEVVPGLNNNNNDSTSGEENDDQVVETQTKFSHVDFDCPLVETLQKNTTCPPEILDCLSQSREPIKMVVALRKAGVRPEIISWRALKSATKKTSTWASALGVM